jgi:hypothetical protein
VALARSRPNLKSDRPCDFGRARPAHGSDVERSMEIRALSECARFERMRAATGDPRDL